MRRCAMTKWTSRTWQTCRRTPKAGLNKTKRFSKVVLVKTEIAKSIKRIVLKRQMLNKIATFMVHVVLGLKKMEAEAILRHSGELDLQLVKKVVLLASPLPEAHGELLATPLLEVHVVPCTVTVNVVPLVIPLLEVHVELLATPLPEVYVVPFTVNVVLLVPPLLEVHAELLVTHRCWKCMWCLAQ